jgi:hypothetical protein
MATSTSASRTQPVADLIQGVSQQAAQQRRDAQCEEQFDCINSVSDGAAARPPFEVIKVWPGRDWTGAFLRETSHDDENYVVGSVGAEPVAINQDDGTDATITGGNSDGYLDAATGISPRDQFRTQAVEDTSILASRTVAPAMAASPVAASRPPEALIFVRAADFSTKFTVTIGGAHPLTATYTTGDAAGDSAATAKTDNIATQLFTAIDGVSGFSAEQDGSVIRVYRADNADFTISSSDGGGDNFLLVFKDDAASFEKLPAKAFVGMILKVRGDKRSQADDYYVQFKGVASNGYWEEVPEPGIATTLNAATMPHLLVNTGLNTFSYGQASWSTRIAGDADTAKDPSYIGKKLREVFYHENRLGLMYNGGAVWSKARFPYTYFPDTVQTVLADAPVDVTLVAGQTSRGASAMDFAVQIDEALYLWATKAQFRIDSGQDPFKQDTVSAKVSTFYEYARECDPWAVGQYLYFGTNVGDYATLRSVQFSNGRPAGSTDVTAHVPKYISSGVRWIVGSDTLRCLFVGSDGDMGSLYLYDWLIQQGEYYQSAWNTWRIPGGSVLWAGITGNLLRILQQRPEGLALLKADLTPRTVDDVEGAGYLTRLDLRVKESQVSSLAYDAGTDTTSFVMPYKPGTSPDFLVVVRADKAGGYTRGRAFAVTGIADFTVTVKGDLTGYSFYAGHRITAKRKESRFYVRNDKGVLPTDRLTVNSFTLEFADTGYTRIEVATPNKETMSYVYEGRTIGLPTSVMGAPVIGTDSLTAPVQELAGNVEITLVNDSFLPSYWQAASYDYTAIGKGGLK